MDKGWKLSVDGANNKVVVIGGLIDFSSVSKNLNLTKCDTDNNIEFDLASNIRLSSVKTGTSALDAIGLET